jgi:uncharacterized protein (TIGR02453 family)
MSWWVYIARCADGSLYTGIARDPVRRVEQHNHGRGAAYTGSRRPVILAHQEPAPDRSAALRREWAIKQLTRMEKEELLMGDTVAKQRGNRASLERTAAPFTAFRPAALRFLTQLKRRNTRPWFEANRAVYESEIRAPLRALVEELDVRLARIAPEIVGDPTRSIFRIHRDVRFSRDKSPYKTHAACWFYHHAAGRGVGGEAQGGAGFYFHFSPTEVFAGGGIWMPPRESLARLRQSMADDQSGLEAIVLAPSFRRRFGGLDEEAMLKRLPRGFAQDHPAGRWLRFQSFTAGRELSRRDLLSPRLTRILSRDYQALTPLVRWLNEAIGFRALARRL